jgi:hypothetical protein
MKSKIDPQFRKLLRGLPHDVRAQARASYRLFKRDPYHPSLHFKELTLRSASLWVQNPERTVIWKPLKRLF